MKTSLSQFLGGGMLALAVLTAGNAHAEVLLDETFDYNVGNLYQQGGWLQSNNKNNPIQITGTSLGLEGFSTGKSVKLVPVDNQDQDCQKPFVAGISTDAGTTYTGITDGSVYVAMLINVQNVTDQIYFMSFSTTNSSNLIKDSAAFTGPYGATYVVPSATDGKYSLAIGKNTSNPTATSDKLLDYNTTYLVVLKYTAIPGTTNDTFEAWINPVAGSNEGKADLSASTSQGDPTRGVASICIVQATGSVKKCPEMLIGPIRVANTWADLWGESQGGEDPVEPGTKGELTVAKPALPTGFALYQFQKYTTSVNIKAKGLTEDITVSGYKNTRPAVTTIPADAAMSEAGYDLSVVLDATSGEEISETLTFTSGETTSGVRLEAPVYPAKTLMNFLFIPSMEEYQTYHFSGNATVTHVDATNSKVYMQDPVGGMAIGYNMMAGLDKSPFNVGDKVTNLYIMATEASLGVPGCELLGYFDKDGIAYGTVTESGVEKAPAEVTLSDLKENLESYLNKLVKIKDVTFSASGKQFGTTGTDITTADGTGKVRVFAGSDIAGTDIPATAASITGISTSPSTVMVTMRSLSDLVATPAGEEMLEVTEELLVDATEYYPINVATPFAQFTVKAQNLAKAAAIYVTGTNRDQFSADLEEIPAGTGEYVITVTMKPTKTGRLQGNLMIDTSNTELTYNKGFAGLAYDPDNMPQFSVDPSTVTEFTAAVGETQEQTITITSKGLLDYGSIRVLGEGQGAFRINSTMFLKDGNSSLKITFAPGKEGTFSETIEFTAAKAETVTVTVKGRTDGAVKPGDKEGDELTFDTSNPLTYCSTDFSNSGSKNKPLSIGGWKNVAVDGNRAWWSYTDEESNECAKVTSYIWGGATENEPDAEMLLLSPALDYKNCTSRLLSFRIKGELLSDGQYGQLSVLYIDPELPEDQRYQVLIGGSDIPTGSNASGSWAEYVVDLESLDLADVFFIGFHYLSKAGASSSETYYVDDFCYGSTTQPFIRIDKLQVAGEAKVGENVELETIKVTGLNLTEPIKVSLEGKYKDYFNGAGELPSQGGDLKFTYSPQEEGEHAVYVNLSSAGAPASQLIIGGRASGQMTGISFPGVDTAASVAAYDLNGREVFADRDAAHAVSALRTLAKGVYILRVTATDGTVKTVKYLRP